MSLYNSAIIIFQKNAQKGRVKTRLAATIGDEEALKVYRLLTEYTHQVCLELDCPKFLYFSDFITDSESRDHYELRVQDGKDLGERMKNAFEALFEAGYEKILILGTDCAELDATILKKAFKDLKNEEVVIGPARDGGYYLLGMSKFIPELFEDMPWSTKDVAPETMKRLNELSIPFTTLPTLSDVDNEADWDRVKGKFVFQG